MMLYTVLASYLFKYDEKKFWNKYFSIQNNSVNKIRKVLNLIYIYRVETAYCCDLMVHNNNTGAYFDGKPVLPHGLNGIIISNQAKLGKNVVILQQVTIGLKKAGGGAPTIGNNVFIGAGAKILGEISIGDGAVIGANAVVLNDVPSNCLAIGVPARIISREANQPVW